jgi:hypothetical protein
MKKILLLTLLFTIVQSQSQFNANAPWLINNNSKSNKTTINKEVQLFNQYWENHDKDQKGSGYKPFMRWENHWRNKTNTLGYQITPQQMWDAFYLKKNALLQRNSTTAVLVPPSNWEPIGPFTHTNTGSWSSGQGRVNTVLVDPSNANTVYIGTPAGGIWKSSDSGTNWIPLGDDLPQIGVSGIAVDYNNSNVIYQLEF